MTETVFFGREKISPGDKAERVRGLFSSVAHRYDLMNDLMSAGLHRVWKARAVRMLRPAPGQLLLDVAGGSGDIAAAFLAQARRTEIQRTRHPAAPARAIICDFSEAMLAQSTHAERLCADALALPIADGCADAVAVAFGLRNIADPDAALREFRRVLRPGGRFLCLEFSKLSSPLLQKLYDRWSLAVIPRLGLVVAGDEESYRYLVDSIRSFPNQETLSGMIETAGFSHVRHVDFSAGIVAAHLGRAM